MKKILCIAISILLCSAAFAGLSKPINAGDDVIAASLVLPFKDISNKRRVINKMNNQAKELSDSEKSVIKKYVFGAVRGEDTFLLINCYLRNNLQDYIPKKEITKPLKCRLDYYANQLCIPISKTKLPQNMILYRSTDAKGIRTMFNDTALDNIISQPVSSNNLEIFKKKTDNKKYVENGFIFASYNKNSIKNAKCILELNAPKNLQAISMDNLGKKNEKTVLINKGTAWEVTDVLIDTDKKTKNQFYKIKCKFVINK